MGASDGRFGYIFILVVLLFWQQQSHSYEVRCPEQSEWSLKASAKCGNVLEYFCLLDDNVKIYTDFCKRNPDITRDITWKKGQRCVFRGNLDGEVCSTERYQPFIFRTDGSSYCAYKKSHCQDEGMIIYKNGSTTSDTQCRCDHTKGFAFVSNTKQSCYCIPSQEDCSCYKKECKNNFKLSSDYNCIFLDSQKDKSECSNLDIRPLVNTGSNNPDIMQMNTDMSSENDMLIVGKKRFFINLSITALFVFTVIITMVLWKCNEQTMECISYLFVPDIDNKMDKKLLQDRTWFQMKLKANFKDIVTTIYSNEIVDKLYLSDSETQSVRSCLGRIKQNKALLELVWNRGPVVYKEFIRALSKSYPDLADKIVKTKVSEYQEEVAEELEKMYTEKIPENIRQKYDQHIEEWKNDNDRFIITEATDYIDERLRKDNCVLVIGRQGGGKSSIIRHIALKLYMEEAYDIIPIVLGPHNILDYHTENRKQIFVIDDFCGKLVINAQNVDVWSTQIDDVLKLIKTDVDRQTERQGFVKFLFSTNEDIFNDKIFGNRLQQMTTFCCKLSEKPLKDSEKLQMIKKYIPTAEAKIKETMISDEVYFPLLCKISEGKTADQIVKLFANLNDFIIQDLLALKDTSVIHFCIITLCALFENCFDEKMLNENFKFATNKEEKAFKEICAEFNLGLHKESNRMRLKEQLQSVGDTYVSKTEDYYSLIHSKVYQVAEIVCAQTFINCFIKFAPISFIAARYRFISTTVKKNDNVVWINEADTEKRYFNRLFMDLEEGITYSTFHNAQLCNTIYRGKFCTYCKKRKDKLTELLLQKKRRNKSLHLTEQSSPDDRPDYEDYLDFKEQYHFMDHKMRKPLIESAWEGCNDIVKMLLEMECDADETDKFGRTALFVASYRNKTNVAETLIESGAKHDLCNVKGQSPLFIAARHGNYDIIKALLKKKASTELCDSSGQTSLMVASTWGKKDVVDALLKAGADISKCDNVGRSSLFLASLHERKDVVNVLIRNKANVHQCNKTGLSPLSVACGKENSDLLDILIKAGADISKEDNDGRSPLFIACEGGFDKIVDILINKGANVMQCDWQNKSPLLIACEKGHLKIVQSLIKSNSIMINLCDEDGRSPLFVACQKRRTEIAGILLENGANLNIFDNKSRSPFYAACRSGDLAMVKLLHTEGAKPNNCNTWGSSPLFEASREGHFDIVKYLINLKCDVEKADSNGKTPLIVACEEGNVEIASILIESGAEVNRCDNEQRSSLHVACFCGHTDIVKLLLRNSADQTLRDIDEHTPLVIANTKEFTDIVKLLTSNELLLNA